VTQTLTDRFRKALADVRDRTIQRVAAETAAEVRAAEERGRREVLSYIGEAVVKSLGGQQTIVGTAPAGMWKEVSGYAHADPVSVLLSKPEPTTAPPDRLTREAKSIGLSLQLADLMEGVARGVPADVWAYDDLLAAVGDEFDLERIEKADRSHLVRKVIQNRLGRRQVVWVKPSEGDKGKAVGEDGKAKKEEKAPKTREQVIESRSLIAAAVSDPNKLNPEQVRALADHIDAITKDEAKGLLRQLGQKVGGDQMAVAQRLVDAIRSGRGAGGVGEALKRAGNKTTGQYGAWGAAAGGGERPASRNELPKRGVGAGEKTPQAESQPEATAEQSGRQAAGPSSYTLNGETYSRDEIIEKHKEAEAKGSMPKPGTEVSRTPRVAGTKVSSSGVRPIVGEVVKKDDGLYVVRIKDTGGVRGLKVGDEQPYYGAWGKSAGQAEREAADRRESDTRKVETAAGGVEAHTPDNPPAVGSKVRVVTPDGEEVVTVSGMAGKNAIAFVGDDGNERTAPLNNKFTRVLPVATPDTPFTGTDSQGREWQNGELVAKVEEKPTPKRSTPKLAPAGDQAKGRVYSHIAGRASFDAKTADADWDAQSIADDLGLNAGDVLASLAAIAADARVGRPMPAVTRAEPPGKSKARRGDWSEPALSRSKAVVTVNGGPPESSPEAVARIKAVLGQKATPRHVASMVGAPDDATVNMRVDGNTVTVSTTHPLFKGPQTRYVRRAKDGSLSVVNESFELADSAPPGLGSKIFSDQVAALRAAGVGRIECLALHGPKSGGGENHYVGYYAWPRMGYDAKIDTAAHRSNREKFARLRERFPQAETILDVLATPEGRAYWKDPANGFSLEAEFDLSPNSRSMKVHTYYQAERKAKGG
jgi:hypothetical protein